MIYKYLVTKSNMPSIKKKKNFETYANKIIQSLGNENTMLEIFNIAISILTSNELGLDLTNRKLQELKTTTDLIINFITENYFSRDPRKKEIEVTELLEERKEQKQLSLFEM